MKRCFKCGAEKALEEFYPHSRMADGHLNKCKECTLRDVREWESKNKPYTTMMKRWRKRLSVRSHQPRTDRYRATERAYREANGHKLRAHKAVTKAVRDGILVRPDHCAECGLATRVQAHHDDYSLPLSVRWLCARCHGQAHWEPDTILLQASAGLPLEAL